MTTTTNTETRWDDPSFWQSNEASYALSIAERYLGKAVADGELAGTTIPVTHALKTIEGRAQVVRDAIQRARA